MKLATFNVLHSLTDDGEATFEARVAIAIDALVATTADVIGLQEASVTTTHQHVTQRLAQGLATRTGVRWHWCWFQSNPHFPLEPDTRPGGGGGPLTEVMVAQARAGQAEFRDGIGVLSRLPILATGVRRQPPRSYEALFCIPPDPLGCNAPAALDARSVLWARIATGAGAIDFFTTHVAHGLTPLSDFTRQLQTILALRYIAEVARADATPDAFVGDFNSTEASAVSTMVRGAGFLDTFRVANPGSPGFTGDQDIHSPVSTASERIDYVYARPGTCGAAVAASNTFPTGPTIISSGPLWPSDHHGVVSTINLC